MQKHVICYCLFRKGIVCTTQVKHLFPAADLADEIYSLDDFKTVIHGFFIDGPRTSPSIAKFYQIAFAWSCEVALRPATITFYG